MVLKEIKTEIAFDTTAIQAKKLNCRRGLLGSQLVPEEGFDFFVKISPEVVLG